MKKWFFSITLLLAITFFSQCAYAENITVIYTAGSRAALYPANEGAGPLGGVSRRAGKIKQLRKDFPDLLLIEGGSSFAGAQQDINRVEQNLDASRTLVYLKSLEMMDYDALVIGQDEYNFGDKFLEEVISKMDLTFLSCNTKIKGARPYLKKKAGNLTVGVIGVTQPGQDPFTADPFEGIKNAVNELKDKKADLIIVLSSFGRQKDKIIAGQIPGINVMIDLTAEQEGKESEKTGETLIVTLPSGAKELAKLNLSLENGTIVHSSIEEIALDNRVEDDAEINNLLPRCYSDKDCARPGVRSACQNPGEKIASCVFQEAVNVKMTMIVPKKCRTCKTDYVVAGLKSIFPGLEVQSLTADDPEAKKMIDEFKVEMLPAYVLSRQVEKDPNFSRFSQIADLIGDRYYLKPSFSGVSYFINRAPQPGQLDLFIVLSHPDTPAVLKVAREIMDQKKDKTKFTLRLVGAKNPETDEIVSPGGIRETIEDKIYACVDASYPEKSRDYLTCRTDNIDSLWWEDCLESNGMDVKKIKDCARGEEGTKLLAERIKFSEEMNISYGPLFLIDNVEIFGAGKETTAAQVLSILDAQDTVPANKK
ncbi:MAG TPA: hypothetical protein PL155_00670 [Candidatus Omnitrophota bacterium]|nr:hypothetical protein [Candidatus Omnitrophota bacterium]HPD85000.1 hypothetical protein [Candidatus Omnitrophota bacterium]HRZ03858.1 hypothetical protein [Candidatus Omnitrophota bacterium]